MLADIIRALVQRVFRDKIVAGIVIVFILGLFFAGTNKDNGGHRFISKGAQEGGAEAGEGAPEGAGQGQSEGQPQGQNQASPGQGQNQASQGQGQQLAANPGANGGQPNAAGQQQQAMPQQNPNQLDPQLAIKFVRWWLTVALDYSIKAPGNHKQAMAYAKPQVVKTFTQSFYTQEVMQGIANGTLAGSFEPATVQAVAVNPDGSVVVTVIGTLSMQSSGSQPMSQSLVMDFLVAKDASGVRMTGFFNKTVTQAPAAAAPVEQPMPQPVGY